MLDKRNIWLIYWFDIKLKTIITLMSRVTVGFTWALEFGLERSPIKMFTISGGESGELKAAASGVPSW